MKKTAWIFGGGAARTVYVAGALYAICKMKVPKPDIIIACSGNAATSLCYVTGQQETIKNVWCKALSTKKFVNFLRFWKIVDIDYLIDTILKKNNPLDMEKIKNSTIEVYFPVTNSYNGKIEYFSNHMGIDIWEVLRAAKMSPIFTNLFSVKGNLVNGKYYSDSLVSSRYQFHVKKAIQEGAERIVVIDSHHKQDRFTKNRFSKLYAYLRNKNFRRNQLEYIKEIENFTVPNNIEFINISPREKLDMSYFDIDNENARKVFQRGYEETFNSKNIRSL
jgi:predicted patatin/cPLA2 family phospholipase